MTREDEAAEVDERLLEMEDKLDNRSRLTKFSFWWLGALIIYIVLIVAFPVPGPGGHPEWKWKEWALELRIDLGHALVAFVAFGAFYDIIFKRREAKIAERNVLRAVGANPKVLAALSVGLRRRHLKNSLISLLGRDIGGALFADVVDPVIQSGAGFRRKYQYFVSMLDEESYPSLATFPKLSRLTDNSRYYWMREDLQYQLYQPSKEVVFYGPFIVVFVFDREQLYGLYENQNVYMRCLIDMDPEVQAEFFQLSDDRIRTFVRDVMGFSAIEVSGNRRLDFDIEIDRASGRTPLVRVCTRKKLAGKSQSNRLRVIFSYPHRSDANHYTFSMPQPCDSLHMEFHGSRQIEGLEMTEYLSNIPRDRVVANSLGNPIRGYSVKVDGWVFPLSGITFTWRNR